MTRLARPAGRVVPPANQSALAADVQFYLSQDPRQLPSRYLYDELGSALFEAIGRLPWYPLKRAEMRLLDTHARDVLQNGALPTVLELGSGSGDKLAALLAGGGRRGGPLDVHLVDISPSALLQAKRAVEAYDRVRVTTHEQTYEDGIQHLARRRTVAGRWLVLFLGSNIGNFDPPAREAFLQTIRGALRPGDRLLLGADLIKPERKLLLAYDDPLGVTAAFNRNLLVRINRELGGTFDLDGFVHRAAWNPTECRVEMHLLSTRRQRVEIPAADLEFEMRDGEIIWTESSYKYEAGDIARILQRCGFRVASQWIDHVDLFSLTYAEAA